MTAAATADAALTAPRAGRFAAIHPLLFAAYPVLFLWSQNLGETEPLEVVGPLVVLVLGAAIVTWVLGRILGDRRRAALIVSPILIGMLMYGHVASYAGAFHLPAFAQQVGWAVLVIVAIVAAVRLDIGRIARIDSALDAISAILVIVTIVVIVPFQARTAATPPATPAAVVAPKPGVTSADKRDVYFLLFDRYASDESWNLLYGIKNDLTPWLQEHGFTVLAKSHANYVRTITSMATTLNMVHLKDAPGLPGPDSTNLRPIEKMISGSLVARQFKELGYRYIHIGSWSGPTSRDAVADVNLNLPSNSDFTAALLDASAVPALYKRLHLEGGPGDKRQRHYRYGVYDLEALAGLADEPGPKFVYSHILLPHPPNVFDTDGSFMTAGDQSKMSAKETMQAQLTYTNTRIKAILGSLLALPEDKRPIIILQADEGPESANYHKTRDTTFDWATAPDTEIESKYGIMNAWYLPGGEDLGLSQTQTSINTFPVLFSRYFGLDYPLLPDTIYTSKSYELQYDVTDVTDRLPSLK